MLDRLDGGLPRRGWLVVDVKAGFDPDKTQEALLMLCLG